MLKPLRHKPRNFRPFDPPTAGTGCRSGRTEIPRSVRGKHMQTKLDCSWRQGIDTDGLNPSDQARIRTIGLTAWMDEVCGRTIARPIVEPEIVRSTPLPEPAPCDLSPRKSPRTKRTCHCGRTFLARRKDAIFCSQACRSRSSRQSNGQGDTDNQNSSLQP